ncbi:MAG TPA: SagB/ThcOx family dehydrogenase [Puia sp.]|jgi:SagB-type dehydrogenase family enzyme|nr:SagB/ThcOx family dehydrogenase [Puia sp.]
MKDPENIPSTPNEAFLNSIYSNTYYQVPLWYDSIGFRNNTLKYYSAGEAGDAGTAEDFLVNSKYFGQNKEFQFSVGVFFEDAHMMMVHNRSDPWGNNRHFDYSGFEKISLGKGIRLPVSFGDVIKGRRSKREFTGDPMSMDFLASILRCASGVSSIGSASLSDGSQVKIGFRTVASGGGLYPTDIIVAALNIQGLPGGIYQYVPQMDESGDFLIRLDENTDPVVRALPHSESSMNIDNAAAVFLLATNPWKSMRKYGSRGLRFIFLEAGGISQNIHLASTALGIGSCDFGAFIDADIDRSLGFDGISQTVIHTIITGII